MKSLFDVSEVSDPEAMARAEYANEFDNPYNCKFIVAVDCEGSVAILHWPNIDPYYYENGKDAETIGLPFETTSHLPGVYEWTCRLDLMSEPEYPDFIVTHSRVLYFLEIN